MASKPAYAPVGVSSALLDWPLASVVFIACMWTHVLAGVVCLATPPQPRSTAGAVTIPTDAQCMRLTRHADYVTVDVVVGTPPVTMPLLLRLDRVEASNGSATRVFNQDALESTTIECDADGHCTDVFLVANGERNALSRAVARFKYRQSAVERALYTTASRIHDVAGEITMRRGFAYWITSSHFCQSRQQLPCPTPRVPVFVAADGSLSATEDAIRNNRIMSHSPRVQQSYAVNCPQPNIALFPSAASIESAWLSILDAALYDTHPETVAARRVLVELGTDCAANQTALQRDLRLYNLDCTPTSACVAYSNMPFRRVAASSLFFNFQAIGGDCVEIRTESTLKGLAKLGDTTEAFLASIVKMAMTTLAAAVVYVRSRRATASSSWLVLNCARVAKGRASTPDAADSNTTEDRLVGLAAVAARIVVASSRFARLVSDGQGRACVAELVGAALSAVHWILRYTRVGLAEDKDEKPITKLGGSTAIVDSTSAVLLAFTEPPTLLSTPGEFNPTARLLTVLLMSGVVLSRCAFSAACCGSLLPRFSTPGRYDYAALLLYSMISWSLQAAVLGITVADLFARPMAYSMGRATTSSQFHLSVFMFIAVVASGLPRLMVTVRHVAGEARDRVD